MTDPKTPPASPSVALVFLAIMLTGTGIWLQAGSGPALVVAGLMFWVSVGAFALGGLFKN